MNPSASKHLRIAGLLEILLGVCAITVVRGLLSIEGTGSPELPDAVAESALFSIVCIYLVNAFKIFAGAVGIILAGRRSRLTVILGVVLFAAQLITLLQARGDIFQIVINIILFVIPFYYLQSAVRVYRSNKQSEPEA